MHSQALKTPLKCGCQAIKLLRFHKNSVFTIAVWMGHYSEHMAAIEWDTRKATGEERHSEQANFSLVECIYYSQCVAYFVPGDWHDSPLPRAHWGITQRDVSYHCRKKKRKQLVDFMRTMMCLKKLLHEGSHFGWSIQRPTAAYGTRMIHQGAEDIWQIAYNRFVRKVLIMMT